MNRVVLHLLPLMSSGSILTLMALLLMRPNSIRRAKTIHCLLFTMCYLVRALVLGI